ncbi:hypothetical protein QO207_25225 [Pseudomonas sp. CAN2814]|uniref:hypothetical protein n=1 Tax=Pseudomonas sp. CAN1 TaxID=3046726 RepID=UPI002648407B|nr:hypothetical protein [Pseudomonas sp. CAN1]MDN6859904.1 hypothetical protein [Pseudomonas sp. CAN1]
MKLKHLAIALLVGSTLAGCEFPLQQARPRAPVPQNWVSVPALPVIEEAVLSLAPTFQGQRSGALMAQICGLARGDLKQDQVNAQLAGMGIDSARLPRQSKDATALLVNGDRAAQATACAAYQATDVLLAFNPKPYLKAVPQSDEKGKDKVAEKPVQPTLQVDDKKLGSVLPIRIAQARTNADVFALIAENLQRKPGLDVDAYREQARELFSRLAPTYIARVPANLPSASANYLVTGMGEGRLEFSSTTGVRFDLSLDKGLTLTQNGVLWYGNGQLLGHQYRLRTAYFQPEVAQLLNVPQK